MTDRIVECKTARPKLGRLSKKCEWHYSLHQTVKTECGEEWPSGSGIMLAMRGLTCRCGGVVYLAGDETDNG